jgi:hypothetical protein
MSKESLPTLFPVLLVVITFWMLCCIRRKGRDEGGQGGKQAKLPVMRPDKGINACSHCRRSHVFYDDGCGKVWIIIAVHEREREDRMRGEREREMIIMDGWMDIDDGLIEPSSKPHLSPSKCDTKVMLLSSLLL